MTENLVTRPELNGLGTRVHSVELSQAAHKVEIQHTKEDVKELWAAVDVIRASINSMTGKMGLVVGGVSTLINALFLLIQFWSRKP